MRGCISGLMVILVLGASACLPAFGDPPGAGVCPGPSAAILDTSFMKGLTASPADFTRPKNGITVPEGAIYDASGSVICILKNDPGTYLIDRSPALDQAIDRDKAATGFETPSNTLCDSLAHNNSRKLNVSNSEFFNRLLWAAGEGDCSVISQTVRDRSGRPVLDVTSGPGAHEYYPIRWATYYHGFVIANLRKRFQTEEGMLRASANSGPGTSVFDSYFVKGDGNTKPFFDLILHPKKWVTAAAEQAYASDKAEDKIKHCIREMLPSITPGVPDPTEGSAFWNHGGSCPTTAFAVKIRFGGPSNPQSADRFACFKTRS